MYSGIDQPNQNSEGEISSNVPTFCMYGIFKINPDMTNANVTI